MMSKYNKLGFKLVGSFLGISLISLLIGIFSVFNFSQILGLGQGTIERSADLIHAVDIARSAQVHFKIQIQEWKNLLLRGGNPESFAKYEIEFVNKSQETQKTLEDLLTIYRKLQLSTTLIEKTIDVHQELGVKYKAALKDYRQLTREMSAAVDAKVKGMDRVPTENFDKIVNQVSRYSQQTLTRDKIQFSKIGGSARNIIIVGVILSIIISLTIGLLISASIVQRVKKVVEISEKMAIGDLDIQIDNQSENTDEIGSLIHSFGKMIENIKEKVLAIGKIADGDLTVQISVKSEKDVLGKKLVEMLDKNNNLLNNISISAEQVAAGSRQVSDSSQALSQGSAEQASTLEEITSSITEIATQTKQNATNAGHANELVLAVKEKAFVGNEQMQGMLAAMEDINQSSKQISKIIKVIDEIAFQTNILALNAAVEAARAGQHGKGFAVVAEEVRNLAARSSNASKETTVLIEGSIQKVESGMRIAQDTAGALGQIVEGVSKTTDLMNEIAIASNEQATGIAQINQGVSQVSQVVQSNTATAEQGAAASEELSAQAQNLKLLVNKFTIVNQVFGNTRMSPEDFHTKNEPYRKSKMVEINLDDSNFAKY